MHAARTPSCRGALPGDAPHAPTPRPTGSHAPVLPPSSPPTISTGAALPARAADNISALVKAAVVDVEPYWPTLFAKLVQGKDIGEMLASIGSAGAARPHALPPRRAARPGAPSPLPAHASLGPWPVARTAHAEARTPTPAGPAPVAAAAAPAGDAGGGGGAAAAKAPEPEPEEEEDMGFDLFD